MQKGLKARQYPREVRTRDVVRLAFMTDEAEESLCQEKEAMEEIKVRKTIQLYRTCKDERRRGQEPCTTRRLGIVT